MKQTDFFFSSVVDLESHRLSETAMAAMYAVYRACKAVNQPRRYGEAILTIRIDAIHQDYDSTLHPEVFEYDPTQKILEAAVKVDLEQLTQVDFMEAVDLYLKLVHDVLDRATIQIEDFDFQSMKTDLEEAIKEEVEILE